MDSDSYPSSARTVRRCKRRRRPRKIRTQRRRIGSYTSLETDTTASRSRSVSVNSSSSFFSLSPLRQRSLSSTSYSPWSSSSDVKSFHSKSTLWLECKFFLFNPSFHTEHILRFFCTIQFF